jgi:hypothetical protein
MAAFAPLAAISVGDEAKLLRMLADVRKEFGPTERYKNEGWRAGRD